VAKAFICKRFEVQRIKIIVLNNKQLAELKVLDETNSCFSDAQSKLSSEVSKTRDGKLF